MTVTFKPTEPCCQPERAGPGTDSLLVFADDWGRHPSSCQHLVRHLLDRHEVHWVNTIGTRPPKLNWSTLSRGWEKVRHWLRGSNGHVSQGLRNLHVHNPKMWPWCGSAFGRFLNRKLLAGHLRSLLDSLPAAPVAVTTIPIVAEVMDLLPVRRWVYYCVDDFSHWPGLDQRTIERMERKLVQKADRIIAVSKTLQERLLRLGRTSHLLTHGVELDFWAEPNDARPMPELLGLERPLLVFWGVIDRRMDIAFVERLASSMSTGTMVLAGPTADHDPALDRIGRVRRLGTLPMPRLASLAKEAAVLIMPYADLPVTRAMQPLKLKEYLATGKPVVVRDLPATRAWSDCLDVAGTPDSFVEAVRLRLKTGLPAEHLQARTRLSGENWQAKAAEFERWVFAPEHLD